MRVVRLNFSHGTHEYHCRTIEAARKAIMMYEEQTGLPQPVAIALDTKGPEIRTGKLAGESDTAEIELQKGDEVILSTNKSLEMNCTKEKIFVDYERLPSTVKPGNRIYVDDGLIGLVVKQASGDEITCEVENGGKLGSHKGINLPGVPVDLPVITERDKLDLKFGAEQKVDMVFASFIRDAKALTEIRQALGPEGAHIQIISKIESQEGLQNIDEIIRASDGIMVARGDLGIEVPTEDVPLAQKSIVAKCNMFGRPVICATQMLDSMMSKPRPTRAEASDVANAVFDGVDAVMLSGETAKGKYPVECVRCMARICAKVETVLWYERLQNDLKMVIRNTSADQISAVTTAIAEAATVGQAKAIVVACPCALVSEMVSQMRPLCPIVMLTGCQSQAARSLIYRGVYPLLVEEMVCGCQDFRIIMRSGLNLMTTMDFLDPGQRASIVLVNAMSADKISFRMFTLRQPTKEELDQQKRCRMLALEQKCKGQAQLKQCQEQATKGECIKLVKNESGRDGKQIQEARDLQEKCNELEACKKLKEADDCQKLLHRCGENAEEEKRGSGQTVEQKCKEEEKETAAKGKQLGGEKKSKEEAEKSRLQEEAKRHNAELKLIEEEIAKLEAAEKAKRLEEEKKEIEDLEKCKKLGGENKKEEAARKCKQLEKERRRAALEKKWKKLAAERKKKRDAERCSNISEENKRKEAESSDSRSKAICKKLEESRKTAKDSNNCNKDDKK
ncbi:hypothetical protein KR009_007542 [Drosophila setifemur]|nr:hypothetical protein KR009_007542 [Drosophila setifemur]